MFLISAAVGLFTGRKVSPFEVISEAINGALPVMSILMGVGMFIQIMTLTGVRGFIVLTCLGLPESLRLLAAGVSIPLFGAVSSFGAASVLGVPFSLAFLNMDTVFTIAGLSFIASLGDMMPPTALAGIFAAQVTGVKLREGAETLPRPDGRYAGVRHDIHLLLKTTCSIIIRGTTIMMMTWIYRGIALLFLIFTAIDMYKEDAPSMKISGCMIMVPLLLRVLMIK